jgi:hypothetical protein
MSNAAVAKAIKNKATPTPASSILTRGAWPSHAAKSESRRCQGGFAGWVNEAASVAIEQLLPLFP